MVTHNQVEAKNIYSFVKHNKSENVGVSPLKSEGITHTKSTDKANILNRQFESVFSRPQPLSLQQACSTLINKVKSQMPSKHPAQTRFHHGS